MASRKKINIISNIVIVAVILIVAGVSIPFNFGTSEVKANPNVIYRGNENSNNVSFMINVYWGSEYLVDMLDVFDAYSVKTTFFVGGAWASKNIELLKDIKNRGHEIANHGFNHRDQDKLNYEQNYDEIRNNHELILKNISVEMNLFAPPSGAYSDITVQCATDLGYRTIMWTHDTIDWRDKDSDLIYKRATENLSNGDLILMHPTENTLKALANILAYAINNGYNPTTVSNTIA